MENRLYYSEWGDYFSLETKAKPLKDDDNFDSIDFCLYIWKVSNKSITYFLSSFNFHCLALLIHTCMYYVHTLSSHFLQLPGGASMHESNVTFVIFVTISVVWSGSNLYQIRADFICIPEWGMYVDTPCVLLILLILFNSLQCL